MKKLFDKAIFEENAEKLGFKLTPISKDIEGGIFFKENIDGEFKELTFGNFLKKDFFEKFYNVNQLN
ncbi:hypothetical protein ES688_11845, partial [Listeria monocytogenes]|nr:hypothetical protein [Listeria monocytogenes]